MGFYFFLFVFMLVVILSRVAWKPARIFEYPYFMAGVFAVFILPQAYSLMLFPGGVRISSITDVFLVTCLCLGAGLLGYQAPVYSRGFQFLIRPLDPARLFHFGLGMVLVGTLSYMLIPAEEARFGSRGGLTGIVVIYLFFVGLVPPGFAVCLLLFRQKPSLIHGLAVALGAVIPATAIYAGRREAAVVFGLTIALTRYFTTGKALPRVAVFGALLFAMFAIPATGAYRGLVKEGKADQVMKLNLYQIFNTFVQQESVLELRNAAAIIDATQMSDSYNWGSSYWNQLVFRFVPAQIVGLDVKNGLMMGRGSVQQIYRGDERLKFEISPGSTNTGMADSFEEFGWLGCLFFFFLAMLFRTVWTAAQQPQALFAQLFYIMVCSSGMRTVTHQSVDFLPGMIYQLVFLSIGFWYAAIPEPNVRPARGRYVARPMGRGPRQ
jgi:hypothetical protein